jgi:hypothetical protein
MYSPNSRVRFWEQEGQRWKTLQLKGLPQGSALLPARGRKYSAVHSGFVHAIRARPFVVSYYAPLVSPLWFSSERSGCAL